MVFLFFGLCLFLRKLLLINGTVKNEKEKKSKTNIKGTEEVNFYHSDKL